MNKLLPLSTLALGALINASESHAVLIEQEWDAVLHAGPEVPHVDLGAITRVRFAYDDETRIPRLFEWELNDSSSLELDADAGQWWGDSWRADTHSHDGMSFWAVLYIDSKWMDVAVQSESLYRFNLDPGREFITHKTPDSGSTAALAGLGIAALIYASRSRRTRSGCT